MSYKAKDFNCIMIFREISTLMSSLISISINISPTHRLVIICSEERLMIKKLSLLMLILNIIPSQLGFKTVYKVKNQLFLKAITTLNK